MYRRRTKPKTAVHWMTADQKTYQIASPSLIRISSGKKYFFDFNVNPGFNPPEKSNFTPKKFNKVHELFCLCLCLHIFSSKTVFCETRSKRIAYSKSFVCSLSSWMQFLQFLFPHSDEIQLSSATWLCCGTGSRAGDFLFCWGFTFSALLVRIHVSFISTNKDKAEKFIPFTKAAYFSGYSEHCVGDGICHAFRVERHASDNVCVKHS